MKTILSILTVIFTVASASAQTILIDFGGGANPTASPDANSNYWNNLVAPSNGTATLVSTTNATTGISVAVTDAFDNSGPSPYATLTGNASLGDLNIGTAISDYFYVTSSSIGNLTFSGLNATKTYTFTIFGTRNATETRTTNYSLIGGNSGNASLVVSGTNLGGAGINYNTGNLAVISSISPNGSNEILLTVSTASTYGYISALQIDVVPEPAVAVLVLGGMGALLVWRRSRHRARGGGHRAT